MYLSKYTSYKLLAYQSIVILSLFSLAFPLQFDMYTSLVNQELPQSVHLRHLNESKLQTFDNIYKILTIKVCFGHPPQCLDLIYDTGMMYVIVGDKNQNVKFANSFASTQSQTLRQGSKYLYSLSYRSGGISAREVCDYCNIGDTRPPYTFNFLIAFNTTMSYNFDGILGLGNRYPIKEDGSTFDERFSFIEYLKFNKVIKKKIFAHEYINSTYGKFYIEEIPKSMGNDYFKCNTGYNVPYLYKWYCSLSKIALSNGKEFTLTSAIAFDTGYIDIRGPLNEGSELFNELLQIGNGKCNVEETNVDENSKYKKLYCSKKIGTSSFPDIHFTINEYKLTLFKNDLFRLVEINGERKYVCKITIDSRYQYWNVGNPVLKNYNMIFNHDDGFVGFKENINYYGESWLSVIILSLLFVGISCAGVYVYINRKRIFTKELSSVEIEKIKERESFDSGAQLNEIKD